MQKFMKKEEEKKNGHKSVRDIKNNVYLDARLKKRENKDNPCSIAKMFPNFKREICVKEHNRIRLATIYIN